MSTEYRPDTRWRDGDTQPIPVIKGPGRHAAPPPRRHPVVRLAGEVGIVLAMALAALVLVRIVAGATTYVSDDGMRPTLAEGQRILVTSWPFGGIDRGDIVVVDDAQGWFAPSAADLAPGQRLLIGLGLMAPDASEQTVARVIGIAGDRVTCCDDKGRVVVNGEPERKTSVEGPTDQVPFDITVPDGRIFVLGDARAVALDSRAHLALEGGTVSLDEVRGRVLVSVWPPRLIDRP